MKKRNIYTLLGILALFLSFMMVKQTYAGVYFITNNDTEVIVSSTDTCKSRGFSLMSCPSGQSGENKCPENPRYFKSCVCDTTEYPFNKDNCDKNALTGISACGENKNFKTCVCPSEYMYNTANCVAPATLDKTAANNCNGKSKFCDCDPNIYKYACNEYIGQSGIGTACNGKYTACACSGFNDCTNGKDFNATMCKTSSGVTYYSSCKATSCSVINAAYKDSIPVGETCTQITTSEKTCYTGCKETCSYFGLVDPANASPAMDYGTFLNKYINIFEGSNSWIADEIRSFAILSVSGQSVVKNGKTCKTIGTCESSGFIYKENDCYKQSLLRCPTDINKVYCEDPTPYICPYIYTQDNCTERVVARSGNIYVEGRLLGDSCIKNGTTYYKDCNTCAGLEMNYTTKNVTIYSKYNHQQCMDSGQDGVAMALTDCSSTDGQVGIYENGKWVYVPNAYACYEY